MKKILTALFAGFMASLAMATVTFDPDTGYGFVGKGDIQLAFGWNNQQTQINTAQVGSLAFTEVKQVTYSAVCSWVTGEGTRGQKTHTINQTKTTVLNAAVSYDNRKMTQITGYNLTGLGAMTVSGDPLPIVGDPCIGEGTGATYTSVSSGPVSSSTGLFVTYSGTTKQLVWPVPVII